MRDIRSRHRAVAGIVVLVITALLIFLMKHQQYAWPTPPQWILPGSSVALMGALAAIMTLFDWPRGPWGKVIAVLVFTLLAALEICVIKREQGIAQANFNKFIGHFANIESSQLKLSEQEDKLIPLLNAKYKAQQSGDTHLAAINSFFIKSTTLARDMYRFFLGRDRSAPTDEKGGRGLPARDFTNVQGAVQEPH